MSCTQRYKAVELTLGKRMSNHWQMQGSYVYSVLDGDLVLDYTNPNNLNDFVGKGATATGGNTTSPDQPHAFKLLGSYQAPFGITVGANYQALSGLPRDRNLSVAFAQGTANTRVEPRGTYRADNLSLLSLRADKSFQINGARTSGTWAEVFGDEPAGQEVFMAWHYARFIDALAARGKQEYPLPTYVNCALNRPGWRPGTPSGR